MESQKNRASKNGAKLPGSVWDNHGHWYFRAVLPGEHARKNYPLCMPGSRTSMPSSKPRQIAEAAAWRLIEEAARQTKARRQNPRDCITVNELCDRYVAWAKTYYKASWEKKYGMALLCPIDIRLWREMYGEEYVANLEHHDMLALRDALIAQDLSRSTVNRRIQTVKRVVAWALDEDLIYAQTKAELTQVSTLKRGRSAARETEPVTAANLEDVSAIMAASSPHFADMIKVQLLTGMRPGEICDMRWCDIEKRDEIWIYRPAHHKNEWRMHPRAVVIGPRAQGLLSEVGEEGGEYIFSPKVAQLERFEAMRLARKTPVQPSQICRAKEEPMRTPGDRWETHSYARAVRRRCEYLGIEAWSPNQLRHNCATEVRRLYGINAARAVLGHFYGPRVTDRYSFEAAEDELIALATPAMIALG